MGNYAVAVVIPTYNRAQLIEEALRSVLRQSVPVAQIVVVDDGSTDGTPDLVGAIQAEGAPITYIARPHTSRRGETRNLGVSATSTPLVAFLDSDDLWLPGRLEVQVEAMERAPQSGFGFCDLLRFDTSGPIGRPHPGRGTEVSGNIVAEMLEEPLAVPSTLMVRREAFDMVGGFREMRINEDYELCLRLAVRYEASYVPRVLVMMREHAGRVSLGIQETALRDYLNMVRRFLKENPDLPACARSAARRGMANVNVKLARLYVERGDRAAALRHVLRAARMHPLDRRLPGLCVGAISGTGQGRM